MLLALRILIQGLQRLLSSVDVHCVHCIQDVKVLVTVLVVIYSAWAQEQRIGSHAGLGSSVQSDYYPFRKLDQSRTTNGAPPHTCAVRYLVSRGLVVPAG
jgi:hypothetical protein